MTKEEARSAVMGAISMALTDPTLQQGFEIICKNLAELEQENAELKNNIQELNRENGKLEGFLEDEKMEYYELENFKNNEIKELKDKTKKIIKELMYFCEGNTTIGIVEEAEQFISEVEK